jgi:molybdenum cofactor cytidylyltransferase
MDERHDHEATAFLSAVILAAGSSTRMGRPKQLLPLRGRPLLQLAVDAALESCAQEVVLVLGHHADMIRAALRLPEAGRARVVINPDHGLGLSTSLRLGLRSTDPRAQAAAILLGDQPGVTAALIDQVARAFVAEDAPMARPVFRSATGQRVPGHPVFLARRVWAEAESLHGDRGARDVIRAHPDWLLELPVEGEAPSDVDTWEDYQTTVDRLRAGTIRR